MTLAVSFYKVDDGRRTKPGQRLVTEHRGALNVVEDIVNAQVPAWRAGTRTPVGDALDLMPGAGRDRRRGASRRPSLRNG